MSALTVVVAAGAYLAKASRMMSEAERGHVVDIFAARPDAGVILAGSRRLRKLRIPLTGRGQSGGGRIVYWYHSVGFPAGIAVGVAKNEADNLTAAQLKRLVGEAAWLIENFGGKR